MILGIPKKSNELKLDFCFIQSKGIRKPTFGRHDIIELLFIRMDGCTPQQEKTLVAICLLSWQIYQRMFPWSNYMKTFSSY